MSDQRSGEPVVPTPEEVFGPARVSELKTAGYWRDVPVAGYLEDWAAADPGGIAVIDERTSLRVGELHDLALRFAGWLAERGVGPGDRVLVQLPNWVEAAVAVYGLARLGAILVPAQPGLRAAEIRSLAQRTEAVAAVIPEQYRGFDHREMLSSLAPDLPQLRHRLVVGQSAPGFEAFSTLWAAPRYDGALPAADDPLGVIFTSGTTSLPKGCVHTSNTLTFSGRNTARAMGLGPGDVVFMPSPLLHTTGLVVGLLGPLIHRLPTVLQAVWQPETALARIAEHGCTATLGATAFGSMLLDAYDPARHDVSAFRLFALAGSPIPNEIVRRLQDQVGCQVMSAYGSTEALIVTATRPGDPVELIAESDGAPVEGVDLALVDDSEHQVPPGEEGEIRVSAPGRFLCYWREPERLAAAVDDQGRLRTGDMARSNQRGYIRITGRKSDLINRGGVKFAPVEVEEVLRTHPGVADVAVVPMPDSRLGERGCAFVVPDSEHSPPDLESLVVLLRAKGVATYKFPERVEVTADLPRTATGKLERYKLVRDIATRVEEEAGQATGQQQVLSA